jgi:hypothetical protein
VPELPVPPVTVAVFFTYTNEPGFQPVPVLNAGVLTDDDPILLLIKHSKFNGYVGAAAVL